MSAPSIVIFGEVLFDAFPDGSRVLGGAPFNVAWHLRAFGLDPLFVSRVGADEEGERIRRAMAGWQMELDGLQEDSELPTGRVTVSLEGAEPSYDIVHPAAWDAIAARHHAPACDLIYHGSLALRSEASRRALGFLLDAEPGLVFMDVNLRAPWWERSRVLESVQQADWVKLNADELEALCGHAAPDRFMARHGLRGLILTHGADGAEVRTASGDHAWSRPVPRAGVVDTVGAGDALAAVIIWGLLEGWALDLALSRAQDFASAICGRRGATVTDPDFYRSLVSDWQGAARTRRV